MIPEVTFQVGSYYAVNTADCSDSFSAVKCVKSSCGVLDGLLLKQLYALGEEGIVFELTENIVQVEYAKVNSVLISIYPVANSERQLSINREEIEQIISSLD